MTRRCNPCDGKGYIIYEFIAKCTYCNGTCYKWGKKCQDCNGTGTQKEHTSVQCTFCDGTGKIDY